MTIYCVANNKGGSKKTATAINLIPHLSIDYVIDLDKYHAIFNVLSRDPNAVEVRRTSRQGELLRWMSEDKNILIDCGGFDSDLTQLAMSQSDVIIAPTNDDPTEQLGLVSHNETMREVSKMVNEKLMVWVLISGVHHSRSDFSSIEALVSELDHMTLLPVVIPHSAKIPAAQYHGKAVTNGPIAAKFNRVAKLISHGVS